MSSGDDLRGLMRRLAAPVAVLTIELEGRRSGVTVGSFVSLSLDPPLVGVSLAPRRRCTSCCARPGSGRSSILAGDQDGLAQHFARSVPPIALWNGIPVREDEPPLLADARRLAPRRRVGRATATTRSSSARCCRSSAAPPRPALAYVGRRYVAL